MTPEQLKSSILQYAIQGKLVEQRAEEGTGEELYNKIQSEKQRLLKEGKIKKEKILPEMSEDEVPFDIPDSWKWVRLGNIINKLTDGTHSTPKYIDYGIPFLSVKDISSGRLDFSGCKYISVEEHKELYKRCNAERGDLLLTKVGTTGIPVIVDTDIEFSLFVSVALIKISKGNLNVSFLKYIINSPLVQDQARVNTRGIGNKNWVIRDIANVYFPLPPLAEQNRIVNKIEELLPYVEKYALNYEKLEKLNARFPDDMKKSILQYAIQGKLVEQRAEEGTGEELYKKIQAEKQRLIKEGKIKREKVLPEINDDEIPFDIPDSWKWARWGELSFSIQYGYNAPAKTNGRIKMVRITDIQNGVIKWDKVPFCDIEDKDIDKYKLAENDILFARTGGTVGKTYIVRNILEESIYAGYLIRTRYSNMLNPFYLYYFMQTNLYWNQLRAGTICTAQPNCNGQTLSKMLIPLPPIIEQQRIVSKVEELLQYINIIK